ncbi:RNA recognition motif-containing protein [Ceratobasidium sp. UAMH 11750]|nr:RNA recognition motif-containing protein [Ceratobasidium sp. UAMH 11750]
MQEADSHGSTLFVSNLPYTATSTDVQTLFSDIAPVRSAFVVLDKETKASKGVAYVSFAIKEDAEMAMGSDKPLELDGRALRLQWADRKGTSTHMEKAKPPKPKKAPRPKAPSDPDAIRTLVLANLPSGIDSKTLWKKARKVPGASEVVYPVPERDGHTAFVKFATAAEASAAVAKLHNHVLKGSRISAVIKKRVDGLVAGRKTGAPSRSSRLIIRNLPWHVNEEDLHRLFAPYGPIYSITLPADDTKASSDRHRGFAFVWMLAHADAERAIKGVNGRVVGAKGKQKKTRREREEIAREKAAKRLRKMRGEESEGEEEGEEGEEVGEEGEEVREEGEEKEGRVVAVDWALSKSKWEEAVSQRRDEEAMEVDDEGGEQSDGSDDEGEEEGEGEDEDEEASSVGDESEEESNSEEDEEAHERPQLPNTDVGTTLFVRNVPFEATEDDLRTLFRAFGPLRYARITLDKETGRSRGTGFVCFWKREDADLAIEETEAMAKELGTNSTTTKPHNPFSMSLLTPDPSASLAKRLVLHGRTLSVARAVAREEADRLREEGERSREKQDKRNLYLMREGVIFPNSPAAAQLSATELATRQASFDSRRALLRSNPSLYVSRTRLSVRRIPVWVSERVLKRLAMYAAREFEDEVKRGEREGLTRDELQPTEQEGETNAKKKGKKGRSTGVRQAKIVRAADRVDAVNGKGKSRGYGFIETEEHADALRILRWANNRPGVVGLMRGWWKEELKDLVGLSEKGEGKDEDRATRLKRLKDELEKLEGEPEGKESSKTLILEFAIENIQVVKRRKERSEASSSSHKPEGNRKRKAPDQEEDTAAAASRKRRKDSEGPAKKVVPPKTATTAKPSKKGVKSGGDGNVGGIIGRKRRERRKGK